MQSSVRAVEVYRRSRLIDAVTSDEDKIAPVYRLEEICQILRSSPLDIVREMLEHTLRRLEHKNPIVKQKALRLIKYAAGKGGPDFRREMQRQAGVVRSLFHYKGQLDALKGDALNKAVRDTAHETSAAIFGSEEKATTMEDVGRRIQGFGSSNYDSRVREDEKKSVLSELVGFGSQSLKQSIEILQNYNHYGGSGSTFGSPSASGGTRSSLSGTYRTQGLRRSLTAEREKSVDREEGDHWTARDPDSYESRPPSSSRANSSFDSDVSNGKGVYNDGKVNSTVEDRLLDSLTVPGGVRLQPSRETLQAFTNTAQKLDAANLVNSLEIKLKAHSWQVRFKALCLVEACLGQRSESKVLDAVAVMFEEDASVITDSLQSPQATLRDKTKKVLDLLGGGQKDVAGVDGNNVEKPAENSKPALVDVPDLMDTGDVVKEPITEALEQPSAKGAVAAPVQGDLFGGWFDETTSGTTSNAAPAKDAEADPFAGMSFHSAETTAGSGTGPDLFSGLDMSASRGTENGGTEGPTPNDTNLFTGLDVTPGSNVTTIPQDNLVDLMGSLSTSQEAPSNANRGSVDLQSLSPATNPLEQAGPAVPSLSGASLSHLFQSPPQLHGMPASAGVPAAGGVPSQMLQFPLGATQRGLPQGIPGYHPPSTVTLQPNAFAHGPAGFTGMNPTFMQHHQFAPNVTNASMYMGSLQSSNSNGASRNQGFADNFDFSSNPGLRNTFVAEPAKEETKAFDFIGDHMSSRLGHKKSR